MGVAGVFLFPSFPPDLLGDLGDLGDLSDLGDLGGVGDFGCL